MYLYNKNISEYVEIVGSEPKSMDNEGNSIRQAKGHFTKVYSIKECKLKSFPGIFQ